MKSSIIFVAAALCTAASAQTVVAVHDGDTLTVLIDQHQVHVRLASIDAPELKQPFGNRSRQSLADICYHHTATLAHTSRDRYGRTVANVDCDGIDANAEQVRLGMAWVYDRYARPDSPLYPLQSAARNAQLGLWQDPSPTPPWRWRHPK